MSQPLGNQFISEIQQRSDPGCWEWKHAKTSCGYGQVWHAGQKWYVHRLAYETVVGSVGELNVLHRCDNPGCYNPAHLFLGTHGDNAADRKNKGRNGPR